jgi:hypothetical protein
MPKDELRPSDPKAECVRVVVRCRPLNSTETADGRARAVFMDTKMGSVSLATASKAMSADDAKKFTYDQVYDENSKQETIYQETAAHIVGSVLEGFNGTIFACAPVAAATTSPEHHQPRALARWHRRPPADGAICGAGTGRRARGRRSRWRA